MRAVVFEAPGRLNLAERPVPHVRSPTDVLIRLVATGICGTDRAIALGEFPASPGVILGHEAVGRVEAAGAAVHSLAGGDPVVLNPTFWCGRCSRCLRGAAAHCEAKAGREIGVDADGTMVGWAVLNERFVHRLPPGVGWARGAMVEPLACVLNNLAAAGTRPGDRVLVVGAGPIGSLCALVAASQGLAVLLAERDPNRVELARGLLPAAVRTMGPVTGPLCDALACDATAAGLRPDAVVDTTGVLLEEAFNVVRPGGCVVVMGEREGAVGRVPLRSLATRGVRVVGAGPYSPAGFQLALDLAPRLPLESIVTDTLPLAGFEEAFGRLGVRLGRPGEAVATEAYRAMKILLVSDEGALASGNGDAGAP
jgi:fructokinase